MKAERKNEENEVDKKLTVSPGSKKFKGRMKKRRGKERSRGKSLGSKDAFRGRGSLREKAVVEEERPSSGGSSSVQVQRCGFIKWEVHGVVAAGESPSYSVYERVVLARSNGTIEVRNSKPGLPVVGYLPSLGVEITSVTFHDDRVLIGSLDGFVAVYDYDRRILLENIDPCGGAIWCLQPSPDAKQIAVGCEDGTVRLLTYGEEGRYDVKKLEKGMARVTTVSWYPDGLSVVAGDGNGGLRRLEISTGRSVASAQIVSKNEFCAIWSCVVSGDTVLTGDSRGVVTIWNGEMLLAEKELWLEGLTGDITSLCESDGSVFVGAANGAVGLVARTVEGGWVAHRGTRVHTNDVRAIVRLGHQGKILSVGDDSVIAVHTVKSMLSNEQAIRIRPSLAPEVMPPVFACNGKVLALYDDRVELWSLPSQKKRYEWPKLLLRIKPGDLGGNLVSASVSTDLTKLVVSGRTTMAAFELDLSFPVNVYPLSSSLPPSRWLSFIDNTELAYVSMDGSEAAVIDVITGETKVKWKAKETCDMGGRKKQPFFKVVDARSDGTIVIVDSTGTMHFRTIDDLAEKRRSRVPVKENKCVLVTLHPTDDILAFISGKRIFSLSFKDGEMKLLGRATLPFTYHHSIGALSYVSGSDLWAVAGLDYAVLVGTKLPQKSTSGARKRKREEGADRRVANKPDANKPDTEVSEKSNKEPTDGEKKDEKKPDAEMAVEDLGNKNDANVPELGTITLNTADSVNVLSFAEVYPGCVSLVERNWDLVLQKLPPSLPKKLFAT